MAIRPHWLGSDVGFGNRILAHTHEGVDQGPYRITVLLSTDRAPPMALLTRIGRCSRSPLRLPPWRLPPVVSRHASGYHLLWLLLSSSLVWTALLLSRLSRVRVAHGSSYNRWCNWAPSAQAVVVPATATESAQSPAHSIDRETRPQQRRGLSHRPLAKPTRALAACPSSGWTTFAASPPT